MNTIENISIDRLDTIDREREITMADSQFQQWCKDMKIGVLYTNRAGINRANDMMRQWSGSMNEGERLTPAWIRKMY
jgi:hypothetical protein